MYRNHSEVENFVTINFMRIHELTACTLFSRAAINDYLLLFPRAFYNDPQISGTLPTEFGHLSALNTL